MIIESLRAVILATQDALRVLGPSTDLPLPGTETRDPLRPAEEDSVYVSTELMLGATQVQMVRLACDEELAHLLANCLQPSPGPAKRLGASTETIAEAFRVFSSILQQSLAATTDWFRPTDDSVSVGPGGHRVRSSGASLFQMAVPVPRGSLWVTVAIANQESETSRLASDGHEPDGAGVLEATGCVSSWFEPLLQVHRRRWIYPSVSTEQISIRVVSSDFGDTRVARSWRYTSRLRTGGSSRRRVRSSCPSHSVDATISSEAKQRGSSRNNWPKT